MKGDLSIEDSQLIEKCANYSKDAYYKTGKGKFIEDLDTDTQSYLSLEGETIVFTGQGTTSFQDWKMDLQIFRTRVPYLTITWSTVDLSNHTNLFAIVYMKK